MFFVRSLLPIISSLSLLASAAPANLKVGGCNVSSAHISLPANQTQLAVPSGQIPKFIALGTGVQNYTCGTTGTFTSTGALATLFDVSCLAKSSILKQLPSFVFGAEQAIPSLTNLLGRTPLTLGQHLFVINPVTNSGIVPRFDFTRSQKDPNAFVDTTKTGGVAAPSKSDVDWLELQQFLGGLAKTVFRVNTKAGQPPATCTPGNTASVPYTALYWFFA